MTSGFRIYSKALQKMKFEETASDGYGFQIEMSAKGYIKKKETLSEVPIIFNERREGESKMDLKIIIEALFIVFKLRLGGFNN